MVSNNTSSSDFWNRKEQVTEYQEFHNFVMKATISRSKLHRRETVKTNQSYKSTTRKQIRRQNFCYIFLQNLTSKLGNVKFW